MGDTYIDIENLEEPLYFGKGQDRVKFGLDGSMTLEEDARKVGFIPVSLLAAKMNLPAGKVSINYDDGTAVFEPGGLIQNQADRLMVTVQYPPNGVIGGIIRPVIKYFQDTANNTEFTIQYRIQPDGDIPATVNWSGGYTDVATSGRIEYTGVPILQQVVLGELDLTGYGDFPTIQGMITRSDGLAGDVHTLAINVEYLIDKVGK